MSGISLITCTADRPEAMKLCEKYVERMQREIEGLKIPIEWLVVNGGNPMDGVTQCDALMTYHYRDHGEESPIGNFLSNLAYGVQHAKHDVICFIEDDDWYSEDYLPFIMSAFSRSAFTELVGEVPAHYYHLPTLGYVNIGNETHASLCQTAIRGDHAKSTILEIISTNQTGNVDEQLWGRLDLMSFPLLTAKPSVLGMKGLPGKKGITRSHQRTVSYMPDPSASMLHWYIGKEDAEIYLKLRDDGRA